MGADRPRRCTHHPWTLATRIVQLASRLTPGRLIRGRRRTPGGPTDSCVAGNAPATRRRGRMIPPPCPACSARPWPPAGKRPRSPASRGASESPRLRATAGRRGFPCRRSRRSVSPPPGACSPAKDHSRSERLARPPAARRAIGDAACARVPAGRAGSTREGRWMSSRSLDPRFNHTPGFAPGRGKVGVAPARSLFFFRPLPISILPVQGMEPRAC